MGDWNFISLNATTGVIFTCPQCVLPNQHTEAFYVPFRTSLEIFSLFSNTRLFPYVFEKTEKISKLVRKGTWNFSVWSCHRNGKKGWGHSAQQCLLIWSCWCFQQQIAGSILVPPVTLEREKEEDARSQKERWCPGADGKDQGYSLSTSENQPERQ